eukprot:TRINITY_DN76685_c0_g1_i1.p2 TRINITY_DN76685_c0_g1~~TRINITY_DN76685_c0_g1_i1.p2  ORF type:complete len:237 (-),score=60.41 TRINITY_DN76685_c0_g1_i1:53-763(-)
MAEEEELPEPPTAYQLTPEGQEAKPTSIGFSGTGKAEYTTGDVYEGAFEDGKRQGKGKYMYYKKTGYDTFKGTFENNKKTGLGRVDYKNGGFYHGHFKAGRRDGEGTFRYGNGDIYSGMWREGKRHGQGTYVFAVTKYEMKGVWKDGQITEGTYTLSDGSRFVGAFKNQKPCGDGIWEMAKGTIVEGAYVQQVVPIDDDGAAKPLVAAAPVAAAKEPVKTETRIFWKTATMVAANE